VAVPASEQILAYDASLFPRAQDSRLLNHNV